MLAVLALSVAESAINRLFSDLSDDAKAPLVGKTLRIHITAMILHRLDIDVVFDDKVRFEPTSPAMPMADCTLVVSTIKELMACLTDRSCDVADFAITGDVDVIHAIRHIMHTHPNSQALIDRFYSHF